MRLPFRRPRRTHDDFRAEIDAHLALEAEQLRAQRGLTATDAQHAARRRFGNVGQAQERFHDARPWAWLDRWRRHIQLSVRSLRRNPGFALAAIVTLGGGIGINTAIFTIVYAVAFRPLPVRDADQLVNIYQKFSGRFSRETHGNQVFVSYDEFKAYAAAGPALGRSAVYTDIELAFDGSATGAARGELVSCGYFETIGTRMALGRPFGADECAQIGGSASVVLSHAVWLREFGGDSTVLGRRISLNNLPFTVVGVAEPGFAGLQVLSAEMWVPVTMQPALTHGRNSLVAREASWLIMVTRLAPGASPEQARVQLNLVARRLDASHPGRRTQILVTKGAFLNFPEVREQGALAGGSLFVLGTIIVVMVCANVMNLLLARGIARRREIGIRLAIGASRGQLIEQLLAESLMLASIGGAVGVIVARLLPPLVFSLIPAGGIQLDASLDARVFAFAVGVSLITAIVFGLTPALQATRVDVVSASRGTTTFRGQPVQTSRLRSGVIAVQIAGSALLLTVASLFLRASLAAAHLDPGYATSGIVSFGLNLPQLGYDTTRTRSTFNTLIAELGGTAGVERVALADRMPLLGRTTTSIELPPRGESREPRAVHDVLYTSVTGSYFETMGIPLVAGRTFTDEEARAVGTLPIIVNSAMAAKFWPGEAPLGQTLTMGRSTFTVVGIARDSRMVTLAEVSPFAFPPVSPYADDTRIVVRARDAAATERALVALARAIDPAIVVKSELLEERVKLELGPARLAMLVAAAAGGLAMLLAIVGIYGVVSYGMGQRTREIAVRIALGATSGGVVRLMMRQARTPVGIGLFVGAGLAVGVGRIIGEFLYDVSPVDPVAFGATTAVIVGASLLATYVPSRRAAGVDPAAALRED